MESDTAPVEATPAGLLFADWIAARGCAKSTAYRMRGELGIEPERRRKGGTVEVWLSQEQADLMTAYADALGRGMSTGEALATVGRAHPTMDSPLALFGGDRRNPASIVPMESSGSHPMEPMESDGTDERAELEVIRCRLAALRDAVELGAPVSTREVVRLLGVRPGGDVIERGRIRAVRLGRNLWQLDPLD